MATRTITTRLAVEGEAEFKKSFQQAESNLKTMRSEMSLLDAEFKGQANSTEALTEKNKLLRKEQEQQIEKVKALEQAVQDAASAWGENDKRTDSYRQQLNKAKKDLIYMNDALEENEKYLDEAKNSADGCASSIDGFGREVKSAKKDLDGFGDELDDAGDELEDFGDSAASAGNGLGKSGGFIEQLGNLKGLLTGGVIVAGAKAVGDAIIGVVEDTAEYRKIMGTLEVSSQKAGYSAEETAEAYKHLNGVLGDSQASATTIANLQAIGLEQSELMTVLNGVIGAWATYGDSIPIDGLAESINETIKAGQVTGTFADVLNWAGDILEDDFNAQLEAANSNVERAQLVMDVLAKQGLTDAGTAWREVNSDIVEYNEAQEEANQAMAELGERLTPVASALKTTFAGAVNLAIDAVEGLVKITKEAVDWLNQIGEASAASAAAHSGRNSSGRNYERSSHSQTSTGGASLYSSAAAAESEWQTSSQVKESAQQTQTISVTVKSVLDGKEIASSVTKYQTRNTRANQ